MLSSDGLSINKNSPISIGMGTLNDSDTFTTTAAKLVTITQLLIHTGSIINVPVRQVTRLTNGVSKFARYDEYNGRPE